MYRILVTGAGGIGGVNFVRALKSMGNFYIIGTDHFPYHLKFNELDKEYVSPRHDDPRFLRLIEKIIEEENIDFLHPQPEVEAEVISQHVNELNVKTFLPSKDIFKICRDKYNTYLHLKNLGLVPKTILYTSCNIGGIFEELGSPLWIRARKGAGGRLSLLCKNPEEARLWINLWIRKGKARSDDFIFQEYLPGRDYAWDSLWYKGELVTSFSRERLEYIFPHLSPSGITGTPVVSRIVHDKRINEVSVKAVKAIDPKPHGFYCIDLKEGEDGRLYITEINLKAHTTLALWAYIAPRHFNLPEWSNMSYLYVMLGLGKYDIENIPKYDIYPDGVILLRHIDVGAKIIWPSGKIEKVF